MSDEKHGLRELLSWLADGEAIPDDLPAPAYSGVTADDLKNALALRSRLEALQHRNRAVEALYRTAVDLTTIKDVTDVLQSIVRRARDLMATDVGYITLVDPEIGGSRVQASVGTTSSAFDALTLQSGVGVGGRVLETGAPALTSDYLADRTFTRARWNDESVAAERLRSILGVPMRAGDDVLGVLFVANRSTYQFSESEISLLLSLAAHAALAVRNAQRYEELERTALELERTKRATSEQADDLARGFAAHIRLSEAVLKPEPLEKVVRLAAETLEGGLLVLSNDGEVRASHARNDELEFLESLVERIPFEALRPFEFFRPSFESDLLPEQSEKLQGFVSPLVAHGEIIGYAYAGLQKAVTVEQERAVRRTFIVLASAVLGARLNRHHAQSSLAQFLDYVARVRGARRESVSAVASRFGITLTGIDHVCVWTGDALGEHEVPVILVSLLDHGVQAAQHDGSIVGLVPRNVSPTKAHSVVQAVAPKLTCGVSAITKDRWGEALSHAKASANSLLLLNRYGEAASRQELEMLGILVSDLNRQVVQSFIDIQIGDLIRYDWENGTGLSDTLDMWLVCGRNHSKTSNALHIHVNTLYRRFAKIEKILGPSYDHGDKALDLQIALRLNRIIRGR